MVNGTSGQCWPDVFVWTQAFSRRIWHNFDMHSDTLPDRFLLFFTPNEWFPVRKFSVFYGSPFPKSRKLSYACSSVQGHLNRFNTLARLANSLVPLLSEDKEHLERDGYTPAQRSHEVAAVIDTMFCELYSCLDGLRQTIFYAYPKVRGVQKDSTEKFFLRAKNGQYGIGFPTEINDALSVAYDAWFTKLRRIRTEITHGDVGSCSLDSKTNQVVYMHGGLGDTTKAFVIENVIEEMNTTAQNVDSLLNSVYLYLFLQLDPIESEVMCGIYKGRMYMRSIAPKADMSFSDGTCLSKVWFEEEPGLECPMRDSCPAYQRVNQV